MSESNAPKDNTPQPEMSKQDKARQDKMSYIVYALKRFKRGEEMFEWMRANAVEPHFFSPDDSPNLQNMVTHYNRKQGEDGSIRRTLYINEKAPFEDTLISMFDQMRRAWHMEQDAYNQEGLNHLSALTRARISEGDRRSFTVAMTLDYTKGSGDFSLLDTLYSMPKYDNLLAAATHFTKSPQNDFLVIRRGVFDEFFKSSLKEILDFELKKTQDYAKKLSEAIDRKTESIIREHMMLPRAEDIQAVKPEITGGNQTVPSAPGETSDSTPEGKKETFNKAATRYDPIILDYGIQPLNSLSVEQVASLAQADFNPESENFLLNLQMTENETPAQYMVTSGDVAEVLYKFRNKYGIAVSNRNFLGGPSPIGVKDTVDAIAQIREQQQAAEAAAKAQEEAKKAADGAQKKPQQTAEKATKKPAKKRRWFGRNR